MKLFELPKVEQAKIFDYTFNLKPIGEDSNLEQVYPAGAENNPGYLQKISENLIDSDKWIVEEKLDGERLILQWKEGVVRATTRRISSKTNLLNEKTDNIPHLRGLYLSHLDGTILDGEIVFTGEVDEKKELGNIVSIMNSLPEKAIKIQLEKGWAKFVVFDCLRYGNIDLRHLSLKVRKEYVKMVLTDIYKAFGLIGSIIEATKPQEGNYQDIFNRFVANGKEGIILKNLDSKYGESHSWFKLKKEETFDVFLTGWEFGKGRNSEVAGYVYGSVYDGDEVVEVCRIGALSDDMRKYVAEDFENFRGLVYEVKAQEVTRYNRLRHPRINRERPDKSKEMCLFSQLTLQNKQE